jgi:hypothetical protein
MQERRAHPRFRLPDVMAMVRVPESSLDYYFHVDNLSLGGLALVTDTLEGFPIEPGRVIDIEVYTHLGTIPCRGVVARIIPNASGEPRGVGVQAYSFSPEAREKWDTLIAELAAGRFDEA